MAHMIPIPQERGPAGRGLLAIFEDLQGELPAGLAEPATR